MNNRGNHFNNHDGSDPTVNIDFDTVGGKSEIWKNIEKLGQYVKHSNPKEWEDKVKQAYEIKKYFESQNPIMINPHNFDSLPELLNAVEHHAHKWQRLERSTIAHRLRYARKMTRHPVFPIDFFNLTYEQFIAYMQYREDREKAGHFALKHELQTMKMVLTSYGIDPSTWFYRLPPRVQHKERILPLPDIVHKMINFKYSENDYENALYQYLFAHNFWIGWRVPSEPCLMTVDDLHFDMDYIIITEKKKHSSTRDLFLDPVIMKGKTRKSLKNWLKWRDKVETNQSGNALYLQPSGKPFTPDYLRQKLSSLGKQVWKSFQPYDSRHWNAVAMLIRTKLETNHFDCYEVKNWLGHERIETTEGYLKYAKKYYRIANYDWIKRTLKFEKVKEDSAKIETTAKNLRFDWKLSEKLGRAWRDSNPRPIG